MLSLTFLVMASLTATPFIASAKSNNELLWKALSILADNAVQKLDLNDEEIDELAELHISYYEKYSGKKATSERKLVIKSGLKLIFKTIQDEYTGDRKEAAVQILKDLVANRGLFFQMLDSDYPAALVQQKMLVQFNLDQNLHNSYPVNASAQFSTTNNCNALFIDIKNVTLISDRGLSGSMNGAIDAGENISINIPVKNIDSSPFRSTSGFLESNDPFIQINKSEVLYCDRSIVGKETVTFAEGTTITPKENFYFTVSPNCPDGHHAKFNLLMWDSDKGKFNIPFEISVYNVGPLTFSNIRIDDDMPGASDGNGNGILEVGETIEYVADFFNSGKVTLSDIEFNLTSSDENVEFSETSLKLNSVQPEENAGVAASFVFKVIANENNRRNQRLIDKEFRWFRRHYNNRIQRETHTEECSWTHQGTKHALKILSVGVTEDEDRAWPAYGPRARNRETESTYSVKITLNNNDIFSDEVVYSYSNPPHRISKETRSEDIKFFKKTTGVEITANVILSGKNANFKLLVDHVNKAIPLTLTAKAKARGHNYAWIEKTTHSMALEADKSKEEDRP